MSDPLAALRAEFERSARLEGVVIELMAALQHHLPTGAIPCAECEAALQHAKEFMGGAR